MKEISGSLWKYYDKPGYMVLITTNGFIRNDGQAVMGRGCALQAARKLPELPKILAKNIKAHGNVVSLLLPEGKATPKEKRLLSFPVKRAWYDKAETELIRESAMTLKVLAERNPQTKFVLPRPGCGNGGLTWDMVKPLLQDLPDNVLVITFGKRS